MYQLIPPTPAATLIPRWAKALAPFSEVVGYSHLGSIFLRSTGAQEYLVLHPMRAGTNAKKYGRFDSVASFESTILKDPDFIDLFLPPSDLSELGSRVGKLTGQEIYYPIPYPCHGGSGALSTYSKGNVWICMEILGQALNIG